MEKMEEIKTIEEVTKSNKKVIEPDYVGLVVNVLIDKYDLSKGFKKINIHKQMNSTYNALKKQNQEKRDSLLEILKGDFN